MKPDAALPYLVVATSGRALAASAARGGYRSIVLDCFADTDTQRFALHCRNVAQPATQHIDSQALLAAADEFAPAHACAGVVYGSGLECGPQRLAELGAHRRICGNTPATLRSVNQPEEFFALLDRLRIAHPAVSLCRPANVDGWLVKRIGACGGAHVRPARRDEPADGCFFQRFEAGRSLSALFLANGCDARVIGINEHLPGAAAELPGYRFSGLLGGVRLAPAVEERVGAAAASLAAALRLKGLNGIDFLLQGERLLVLEINARPTAAIEVYDEDYSAGLFDRHLRACAGELAAAERAPAAVRGCAVVYAEKALTLGPRVHFPPWCSDVPAAGTYIGSGAPICTVRASGSHAEEVRSVLRRRQEALRLDLYAQAAA